MIMDRSEYDVVIRGGGLAGFCLTRQLLRRQSDLSVPVIERTPHPMPAAAHKRSARGDVATYFSEVLGLRHHMETPQIRRWACASSRLAL